MIVIYYLIFFILGIVFWQVITPLVDSLVSLMLTAVEVKKAKLSIDIASSQVKIQDLHFEEESSRILCFTAPPIEDEAPTEEEYDEDEDI